MIATDIDENNDVGWAVRKQEEKRRVLQGIIPIVSGFLYSGCRSIRLFSRKNFSYSPRLVLLLLNVLTLALLLTTVKEKRMMIDI